MLNAVSSDILVSEFGVGSNGILPTVQITVRTGGFDGSGRYPRGGIISTISYVLLAARLLKETTPFISETASPTIISGIPDSYI